MDIRQTFDETARVLAASAERGSEHPLGEAIVRQAEEEQLSLSVPTARSRYARRRARAS